MSVVVHFGGSLTEEQKKEECSICYGDLWVDRNEFERGKLSCLSSYGRVFALPCGHIFHDGCLQHLVKNECPTCRKSFDEKIKWRIKTTAASSMKLFEQRQRMDERIRTRRRDEGEELLRVYLHDKQRKH